MSAEVKDLSQKDKVRALYKIVKEKESQLDSAEKANYVTDGNFRFGANTGFIDIKTSKNVKQLRDIVAFLISKEKETEEANKMLEIEETFDWQGASVKQWISDVKIRVTQLSIVNKRTELKTMREKLLRMDTSLLAEIELEEMEKALM